MAAEHVEIRDQQLRLQITGLLCGRLAGGGEIRVLGAAHEGDRGQARLRLGVGRALLELLLVGRDGGIEIAALDRLVRLGDQRRQRLLLRLLGCALPLGKLHALLARDLHHLGEKVVDLRIGDHRLDDRLKLSLEQQQQGGQLLDLQGAGDALLGVRIDDPQTDRTGLRLDCAAQAGEELVRLRHPSAGDQQQGGDLLGVGDELLEPLLGDGDLVGGGRARGGSPCRRGAGGLLQRGEVDDSVRIGHW
ncbi:MAG: hypothetical protein ACTMKY_03280 [Dermabacteraceae bacterium]